MMSVCDSLCDMYCEMERSRDYTRHSWHDIRGWHKEGERRLLQGGNRVVCTSRLFMWSLLPLLWTCMRFRVLGAELAASWRTALHPQLVREDVIVSIQENVVVLASLILFLVVIIIILDLAAIAISVMLTGILLTVLLVIVFIILDLAAIAIRVAMMLTVLLVIVFIILWAAGL